MSKTDRMVAHALVIRHENGYIHAHSNWYPSIIMGLEDADLDFDVDITPADDGDKLSIRDVWQWPNDEPDQLGAFGDALSHAGMGVAAYDSFYDVHGDGPDVKYRLVSYTSIVSKPVVWTVDYGWEAGAWFFGQPQEVKRAWRVAKRLGIKTWDVPVAGQSSILGSFAVDAKTGASDRIRKRLKATVSCWIGDLIFRPCDDEPDPAAGDESDVPTSEGSLDERPPEPPNDLEALEREAQRGLEDRHWEERCAWNPELRKIRWSVSDAPRRPWRHPNAEEEEMLVTTGGRAASKLIRQRLNGEEASRHLAVLCEYPTWPPATVIALRVLDIAEVMFRRLADGDADGLHQLPVEEVLARVGDLVAAGAKVNALTAVAQFRSWLFGPVFANVDLREAVEVAAAVASLLPVEETDRAKQVTKATRQANTEQLAIPRFIDPGSEK